MPKVTLSVRGRDDEHPGPSNEMMSGAGEEVTQRPGVTSHAFIWPFNKHGPLTALGTVGRD